MRTRSHLTSAVIVLGLMAVIAVHAVSGDEEVPSAALDGPAIRALLVEEGEVDITEAQANNGLEGVRQKLLGAMGETTEVGQLKIDYPLDASVFPPGFVPPTFLWHDGTEQVDTWLVEVTFEKHDAKRLILIPGVPPPAGEIDPVTLGPTNEVYAGTEYQQSALGWTPDKERWADLQGLSKEVFAFVTFRGFASGDPGKILSRGQMTLMTSADPVGAPIFYRDVPLMPSRTQTGVIKPLAKGAIRLISWRLKDVTRPESKVVLTGMPACANCHSFSRDGRMLGMDVDGPQGDKGAYALAPLKPNTVIGSGEVISWNAFSGKPEGHKTIGFLSRISPDGAYVITTLNEALYVSNFTDYKFLQVFYPTRGILAWYSRETDEMKALPGADDPTYVHCDAAWTPDGKNLVFARAKAIDPYPPGTNLAEYANDPKETEIRYDLYRMPFAGGKGGTPVPIEGASENGMSNTFPKVSPDGRWVVFTKCKNGQLMRPDGRLWIVPLEGGGGKAREMRCNTSLMNSWHSFSPNGRWMVFSSKVNTPYTQMFLTHVDEDGTDTPPILIPNSTAANRAANIPEFLNAPYEALDAIDVPAVDHHRLYLRGLELVEAGRHAEALPHLRAALEKEPGFKRALVMLCRAQVGAGEPEAALETSEEAVRLHPNDADVQNALGFVLAELGRREQAIDRFRKAIRLDRGHVRAHKNLGFAMLGRGDVNGALLAYFEALRFDPEDAGTRRSLAAIHLRKGEVAKAVLYLEKAIQLEPDVLAPRLTLAWHLATSPEDAVRDGERAVEVAEKTRDLTEGKAPGALDVLAAAYAEAGRFEDAVLAATRALELVAEGAGPVAPGLEERLRGYVEERPHRIRPR